MFPPVPTALAVLLALLVVAAPLRAQVGASQDEVRYRAPDGTIKAISRAEHQSRVADLRQLLDALNSNRMVLITVPESDSPIPVPYERLQNIARYLEKKGGLTALEVPGWINDQLKKSRDMIPTLTQQLEGLTSNPQNPAGSTVVEWPVPMDWQKVKGTLRVTHRVSCQYSGRRLPLAEPAHFTLQGDGKAFLIFDAGDQVGIPGTIVPDGTATGFGGRTLRLDPPLQGVFRWTAHFNRQYDALVLSNYTLAFVPEKAGSYCETSELIPEVQTPTDLYADQFPTPMSWVRTKGEVQGEFSVLCPDGTRIAGAFRIQLDGGGRVDAQFGHESTRGQLQANARIEDRGDSGRAVLTATDSFGRTHWDLRLVRDGNRITLDPNADSGLRIVPANSTIPCNPAVMVNVK